MDEKDLGKRLQLARKRSGLTQQELCHKAGLSYSTLAKIERGAIRSPSVFTVASIATATQTPLEQLLDLADQGAGSPAPAEAKKRSKSGVRFVYFDVNGTVTRFYERAFAEIARDSHKSLELIETLFWRYDARVCKADISNEEVDAIFAKELGLSGFHWLDYYLENVEVTPGVDELLEWAGKHYKIGLLTNNWLGFTEKMIAKKLIPDLDYTVIVESAKVECIKPDPNIYKIAEELASYEPSEILLVDDNPAYLRAADQAGWQVLRFNGFEPAESIERVKTTLEF